MDVYIWIAPPEGADPDPWVIGPVPEEEGEDRIAFALAKLERTTTRPPRREDIKLVPAEAIEAATRDGLERAGEVDADEQVPDDVLLPGETLVPVERPLTWLEWAVRRLTTEWDEFVIELVEPSDLPAEAAEEVFGDTLAQQRAELADLTVPDHPPEP
jgi:hypothetical protein